MRPGIEGGFAPCRDQLGNAFQLCQTCIIRLRLDDHISMLLQAQFGSGLLDDIQRLQQDFRYSVDTGIRLVGIAEINGNSNISSGPAQQVGGHVILQPSVQQGAALPLYWLEYPRNSRTGPNGSGQIDIR